MSCSQMVSVRDPPRSTLGRSGLAAGDSAARWSWSSATYVGRWDETPGSSQSDMEEVRSRSPYPWRQQPRPSIWSTAAHPILAVQAGIFAQAALRGTRAAWRPLHLHWRRPGRPTRRSRLLRRRRPGGLPSLSCPARVPGRTRGLEAGWEAGHRLTLMWSEGKRRSAIAPRSSQRSSSR